MERNQEGRPRRRLEIAVHLDRRDKTGLEEVVVDTYVHELACTVT